MLRRFASVAERDMPINNRVALAILSLAIAVIWGGVIFDVLRAAGLA